METALLEAPATTGALVSSTQSDKKSDKQAAQRSQILFKAEVVDMDEILGGTTDLATSALSHCSKGIVVHTPEGLKLVNTCSKSYELVQVEDIILPFEEILGLYFDYKVIYRHSEHCRFFVDYIIDGVIDIPTGGNPDKIQPRIRIQHSYSGDVQYKVEMGFWRQICSNGMGVFDFSTSIKTKHTKHRMKEEQDRTIKIIGDFIDRADGYTKPFAQMAETKVTGMETRLQEIIEATDLPKRLNDSILLRAAHEVQTQGLEKTEWLLYNAINYQLNHNYTELGMMEWNRQKLDAEVLNFMLSN